MSKLLSDRLAVTLVVSWALSVALALALTPPIMQLALDGGAPDVLVRPTAFVGATYTLGVEAEGYPNSCEFYFWPPTDAGDGIEGTAMPDAVDGACDCPDGPDFETQWTPDIPGTWLLQARVFYLHEWPAGQLYRTNAYLRVDVSFFNDGFESGDTSAWSLTIN